MIKSSRTKKKMKKKEYYLKLNYPIVIEVYTEYNGKKYFGAKIPLLPGCGAEGATIKEVLKRKKQKKLGLKLVWKEV